ncbi:MAG: DUF4399 domain-containing protein [Alphaproteobacteria bacterium]|nr:MAG: DUF4399 domain-containing protein [Alphaproteobacteria bacterium]
MVLTALMLTVALMPVLSLAEEDSGAKRAPAASSGAAAVPAPQPAAFFVDLKDGDTVASPLKIKFGVNGLEVAPAGTDKPNTGHFHLLIDTEMTAEELKTTIPADDKHVHYGKAQTEAEVTLTPGKHTLQILMGDGNHVPHNPPVMSDKITVTVK